MNTPVQEPSFPFDAPTMAPLAGIVAARNISPAMEVRPDATEPLFVVTDMRRLSVLVDVPERDLPVVTVGKATRVEVSAYPERSFEGKVIRVAPTLDPQTRRAQARLAVDNAEGLLKPEMYARVAILADAKEELPRVPIRALLVDGVKNYVFVERDPGVFEKREDTLAVQTRNHAWVWAGLKAGEKVVSVGALLLSAELASSSRCEGPAAMFDTLITLALRQRVFIILAAVLVLGYGIYA